MDELPEEMPDLAPSPLEQAIGKQGFDRYEKALKTLKPADRDAIVARIELQRPLVVPEGGLELPGIAMGIP
ncbi:hypothetical protein D3C83_152500 [compost metagenome]